MPKILVADDVASVRALARAVLSSGSYEVIEAADGLQALRLAREQRPDLALLDYGMPGLTGLSVCLAIRKNPTLARMRVVIMSATITYAEVGEPCADAFIDKPFSAERLRDVVQQMLARDDSPQPQTGS